MDGGDPFVAVKEEVKSALKEIDALFQRWQQLFDGDDREEFEWVSNELQSKLKSIGWDLDDLDDTIVTVAAAPARYNISLPELDNRRKFVVQTKDRAKEVRDTINSGKAKAKKQETARGDLLKGAKGATGTSRYAKVEAEMDSRNQDFIEDQTQTQTTIMKEQDMELAKMGETIGVLKDMGKLIENELDDQNELLDDFGTEMDTVTARLQNTLKKLDKTLDISKDGKQSCCICLLVLVVLILIIVYFTR